MGRDLAYSVVDVFAERALEGNPLAVFHDGRGLSDAEMQALARETNLSETTFVLPADDPGQDRAEGVRVRIFTTEEELPFAGHPTLGTASWLQRNHPAVLGAGTITLRLNAGPVPVRFRPDQATKHSVYGTMRQPDPRFGAEYAAAEVAAVIGMPEAEFLPGYRPQVVSTGNPFCIVPLRSVAALETLQIPQREAVAWLKARGIRWFYCIAPDAGNGGWRARMQWHSGEDPATGSAAGPCIAWLVQWGLVESKTQIAIWQGVEMQRPSRLDVQAERTGDGVTNTLVGGRTIFVASGIYRMGE
jgi:trans-2,3-dihydro-3-hydroxyanthranilate isomerase